MSFMGNYGRDNNSRGRSYNDRGGAGVGDREMFKATCADCGKACEIPFKPSNGRPVYCRDCFKKHAPQESRGGERSNFSRDRNDRGGRNTQDRPMFDAVCDNCGNNCRVPFAPREGKETLCSNCFEAKGGDPRSTSNQSSQALNDINAKLDRILELLSPTPKQSKKETKAEVLVEENIVEEVPTEEVEQAEKIEVKKQKTKKKTAKS